jgi:hypothetical protein
MKAHDAIRHTINTSARLMLGYIEDLTDADLMVRPVPGANTIAWQLGHLISAERYFVESIKAGSCPALPNGFDKVHGKDTASSDDAATFCSKEQYQSLFAAQREATLKVLDSLNETDLDAPGPERMRAHAPTVGALLNLTGTHILMHVGQFAIVRRKLGKPALF